MQQMLSKTEVANLWNITKINITIDSILLRIKKGVFHYLLIDMDSQHWHIMN